MHKSLGFCPQSHYIEVAQGGGNTQLIVNLALFEGGFFMFSEVKKNIIFFFSNLYNAAFQCGRYNVFKKKLNFFLHSKTRKNRPQKLLIIGPNFSVLPT
jgi:hypothetical protein